MRMEYHWNELNSHVGNQNELGMMIPKIMSRTSVGSEVTKEIGLNIYGSETYVYSWNAQG
jgi:hypothetical protein